MFEISKEHNHGPEEYQSELIDLENQLKRSAEQSVDSIRNIFDDVCHKNAVAHNISFERITSAMYKRRRSNLPADPRTVEEFVDSFTKIGLINTILKIFYI